MKTERVHNALVWSALLAKWTEFARASLALPENADGRRWRSATAQIIGLQAVTFALAELDELDHAERAVGTDKAAVLIRTYAAALHRLWHGEPLHTELVHLISDARRALHTAINTGMEWCAERAAAWGDPSHVVSALLAEGFGGDLYLAARGCVLFPPAPIAFIRPPAGGRPEAVMVRIIGAYLGIDGHPEQIVGPRQVYRQFDPETGAAVRDYVAVLDEELPAGQPLLVPVILAGRAPVVPPPAPVGQPGAALPVVFAMDRDRHG